MNKRRTKEITLTTIKTEIGEHILHLGACDLLYTESQTYTTLLTLSQECLSGQALPANTDPQRSKAEHVGSNFSREKGKRDAGSTGPGHPSKLTS